MKIFKPLLTLSALFLVGTLISCASSGSKSADVSKSIRTSLDQAGFEDVSVSQDRDKGVVTLGGNVSTESAKSEAESIAKSLAGGQVVSTEIAVVPAGNESDARKVNSALDEGIEENLKAALIQRKLDQSVNYDIKNAVVTLTGEVTSQSLRSEAEKIAGAVPNVKQVVNELQVKNQKATSSN